MSSTLQEISSRPAHELIGALTCAGWPRKDIARAVNISQSTISRICKRQHPQPGDRIVRRLQLLVHELGLDINEQPIAATAPPPSSAKEIAVIQARGLSLCEAASNAVIGLAVSWAFTFAGLPFFGFQPSAADAAGITLAYFLLSFARSYLLRRAFDGLGRRLGQWRVWVEKR